MPDGSERRRHSRGKRLLRFEFTHGGGTVRALSANVSAGGAFLCANELPAVGQELQVRFLAGTDSSRTVTIRSLVTRAVAEPSETEPNRGVAVRWIEASTAGNPEAIEDFLNQFKDEPGGQILVPDDRDLDPRYRYLFPEPQAEGADDLHDAGGAIPMGAGADGQDESAAVELSMQDFLVAADDDDDDDGPPTQPIDAPPGALDELFADEQPPSDDAATMEEVSLDLLADDGSVPDDVPVVEVVPSGRAAAGPPPPPPAAPSGPGPGAASDSGVIRSAPRPDAGAVAPSATVAATTPTGPPPATPPPEPTPDPARTPSFAPDPSDEDVGSGLVPVDIPVTLACSGRAVPARTTHLTETQIRVMVSGEPPAVYSRVAIEFPPKGRKNKPQCVLRANVTRVRKSATGEGGLVTLRLAMQNEPSDLRAYRKIVKKAGK